METDLAKHFAAFPHFCLKGNITFLLLKEGKGTNSRTNNNP